MVWVENCAVVKYIIFSKPHPKGERDQLVCGQHTVQKYFLSDGKGVH